MCVYNAATVGSNPTETYPPRGNSPPLRTMSNAQLGDTFAHTLQYLLPRVTDLLGNAQHEVVVNL